MIKIVRIPKVLNNFFETFAGHFNKRSFIHFKILCIMIALSCENKTINQISFGLAFGAHRTKLNDFLIHSPWNEKDVLKDMANKTLKKLYKKGAPIFLVLDDSKKKKTGKHVEGTGTIFDPVAKTYMKGHQFLAATIYYRGYTIPYAIRLYLKKEISKELNKPFKKLPELAQEIINELDIPFNAPVYILTDSFYANKTVIDAARIKDFHFIGALKENRTFIIKGIKTNVESYIQNTFKKKKKSKTSLKTKKGISSYSFISTITNISKIGSCRLVLSRKGSHKKILAIACTDINLDPTKIIEFYSFRWSIEVWFKQAKQHLSLGALHRRCLSGVIKHLHLSACAYLLLTHLNISSAKGKRKNTAVSASLLSLQNQLKDILLDDMFNAYIENQKSDYIKNAITIMKNKIININYNDLLVA